MKKWFPVEVMPIFGYVQSCRVGRSDEYNRLTLLNSIVGIACVGATAYLWKLSQVCLICKKK